ncbi:hypothetical protein AGMMS50233_09520 [Endomicrobiia bacterium]|nr:hypothetical protein AGMMS50233_09520 [Endomicrobiia bacterium]
MKSGDNFLNNLLNALLPNRAAPVLARVMKAHEGAGKNKYSVDVKVLKAGTLEETDQEIAEVPISPIWATKKKRGIYAMPTEDQIVIVEFIGWNVAYPYVSGIWADEYEADDFGKDKFVITDGNGMVIIIDATENSITVDNGKGCTAKLEDGKKITLDNGKDTIKMINGDIDIICPKPIGINGGTEPEIILIIKKETQSGVAMFLKGFYQHYPADKNP